MFLNELLPSHWQSLFLLLSSDYPRLRDCDAHRGPAQLLPLLSTLLALEPLRLTGLSQRLATLHLRGLVLFERNAPVMIFELGRGHLRGRFDVLFQSGGALRLARLLRTHLVKGWLAKGGLRFA